MVSDIASDSLHNRVVENESFIFNYIKEIEIRVGITNVVSKNIYFDL